MSFVTVASVDELQSGERLVDRVGEYWVAVFNVDGQFYAVEDQCTHDGESLGDGEVDIAAKTVQCPRHGAIFDLETGKPTFPAVKPVPRFAVRVQGSEVQVDVEQQLN
ncbi:MAG: non-heme iron oxygenase ferredoxin subunit [Anaerolineae bacterium]|jgi:3-phenylpropionate/trans-cinnamate dioxygenase ferredoxin subunit|nr:non-heme iron oxygenase ferredoxin subunit [Anaerolineae bacterium]